MGLTIHYSLQSDAGSPAQARQQVEKLRQAALDLAMAEVGKVVEFAGAECELDGNKDDEGKRWLLIQARRMISFGKTLLHCHPLDVIAFTAWPGEECEVANSAGTVYLDTETDEEC